MIRSLLQAIANAFTAAVIVFATVLIVIVHVIAQRWPWLRRKLREYVKTHPART